MNRFGQGLLIVCSASGLLGPSVTSSQQPTASSVARTETRTRAIVASFSKSKHVVKERHGIRREKYKEVRSEPVIRSNLQSFSGTYEAPDLGFALHLRVGADGRVEGSGEEQVSDGVIRRFQLSNARVEGALLTGTNLYVGGSAEQFEGVFINRTSYDSPDDKGVTEFGLGVVGNPIKISGLTIERIFYRLKR